MFDRIDEKNKRSLEDVFNPSARPKITVDVEKYKVFLDDPALSEADKEDFLQALWSIIVAFVDLGFGVHPLQEVYGQEDADISEALNEALDMAEGTDSNRKQKDGSPSDGLEME